MNKRKRAKTKLIRKSSQTLSDQFNLTFHKTMANNLGTYHANPYLCRSQRLPVKKNTLLLVISAIFLLSSAQEAFAQNRRRVIQLSGIVTDTAGVFLPGVNFYV